MTLGSGIKFNSDTADANMLDDYEEGTWTPVLKFGGASVSTTYSLQSGVYTKIGRLVHCSLRLTLTSKGSSTGSAQITGLPFGCANISANYGGGQWAFSQNWAIAATDGATSLNTVDANTSLMQLRVTSGTGYVALDDEDFGNTTDIIMTVTYQST